MQLNASGLSYATQLQHWAGARWSVGFGDLGLWGEPVSQAAELLRFQMDKWTNFMESDDTMNVHHAALVNPYKTRW